MVVFLVIPVEELQLKCTAQMGDEYTWLVGQDDNEKVKAIVTKEDDDDNLLVNTLKNEDISADLYSEFLGLQERVEEANREEKDLYRYSEEIRAIEPYRDPNCESPRASMDNGTNTSTNTSEVPSLPSTRTHSLLNLAPTVTPDNPNTMAENIIQIGDRFYTTTAVLFAALKIHLGQTIQGAEVMSRGSYTTISTHGKTAGRVMGRHLVSGAAVLRELASVRMIAAVIRETCHFTIDRTNLYTKW